MSVVTFGGKEPGQGLKFGPYKISGGETVGRCLNESEIDNVVSGMQDFSQDIIVADFDQHSTTFEGTHKRDSKTCIFGFELVVIGDLKVLVKYYTRNKKKQINAMDHNVLDWAQGGIHDKNAKNIIEKLFLALKNVGVKTDADILYDDQLH